MKKFFLVMPILFLVLTACSSSKKSVERGVSSEDRETHVIVSDKTFKELTRPALGAEISVIDYRGYRNAWSVFRWIVRKKNEINNIPVEDLCGSYEETKKLAIKKNIKRRLACSATGGWICPFEVIAECNNGQVLQYFSPYEPRFFSIED